MVGPTHKQVQNEIDSMGLPTHMAIVITMIDGTQERHDWDWGGSVRASTAMDEVVYAAGRTAKRLMYAIAYKRVKRRLEALPPVPEGGYHD